MLDMVSRSLFVSLMVGLVIWAGVFADGCRKAALESVWLDSTSVGGGQPDWWSVPAYEVKSLPGMFTLANDSSAVYFHLRSTNRMLAQRLRMQGLTWHIRPAEDPEQELVVRYPVRTEGGPPPKEDRPPLPEVGMAPGAVFDMLERQNDNVEIMCRDSVLSGRKTRDEAFRLGVATSMSEMNGAVEYTLRLSLAQVADWLKPGQRLEVEVESPAMDTKAMRERGRSGERPSGGMRPPGGMGGGPRPGGGRPGGMSSETRGLRPDQALRLKYTIELASGPGAWTEKKM